jgi:hypothetical protein
MSRVQTAVLHIDTLWLDYHHRDGKFDSEQFDSYKEACLKLSEAGYRSISRNSTLRQKIYMRAVNDENDEASK